MRSPSEIAFRLRQEVVNLARFLFPAKGPLREPLDPTSNLADPAVSAHLVMGTAAGQELIALADQILAHRFPIFGELIDTGPKIDWHRDYHSGKTAPSGYFRRLPYLDFSRVGDHKWTWELNRHQHLIVLAQAFRLTGRREFVVEIEAQLADWAVQNPVAHGINWASALEVALRALSWLWVDRLAGSELRPEIRLLLQNGLWLHASHLQTNLSTYFSPNTHLLGEAVALHAIGACYPRMPNAAVFARDGAHIVETQLDFQMCRDGSHFEQSTYYQVYAVDFFAFYYILAGRPAHVAPRLKVMAEYLDAITGPSRRLFFLGDDDGGRLFHPYGTRSLFARATLATCAALLPEAEVRFDSRDALTQAAWWLGAPLPQEPGKGHAHSANFPDSGLFSLVSGQVQILFDAGSFGWGGAGHSHADTLQILVRNGDKALLDDPGTFVYTASAKDRNWFRGTSAHNTVVIDGLDQATPASAFRWLDKPVVRWNSRSAIHAEATCEYRGFSHKRTVLFCQARAIVVLDRISLITHVPGSEHTVEQFWNGEMLTSAPQEHRSVWRSECYGSRTAMRQTVARQCGPLPMTLAAALPLNGNATSLGFVETADMCTVHVAGITALFPKTGDPRWSETP